MKRMILASYSEDVAKEDWEKFLKFAEPILTEGNKTVLERFEPYTTSELRRNLISTIENSEFGKYITETREDGYLGLREITFDSSLIGVEFCFSFHLYFKPEFWSWYRISWKTKYSQILDVLRAFVSSCGDCFRDGFGTEKYEWINVLCMEYPEVLRNPELLLNTDIIHHMRVTAGIQNICHASCKLDNFQVSKIASLASKLPKLKQRVQESFIKNSERLESQARKKAAKEQAIDPFIRLKRILRQDLKEYDDPLYEQTEAGDMLTGIMGEVESQMGVYLEPSIQGGQGGMAVVSKDNDCYVSDSFDYQEFNEKCISLALTSKSKEEFCQKYRILVEEMLEEHPLEE